MTSNSVHDEIRNLKTGFASRLRETADCHGVLTVFINQLQVAEVAGGESIPSVRRFEHKKHPFEWVPADDLLEAFEQGAGNIGVWRVSSVQDRTFRDDGSESGKWESLEERRQPM